MNEFREGPKAELTRLISQVRTACADLYALKYEVERIGTIMNDTEDRLEALNGEGFGRGSEASDCEEKDGIWASGEAIPENLRGANHTLFQGGGSSIS